jgi:hypothetical protein
MIDYYYGGTNKLELGIGLTYFAGKIDDDFFGNKETTLISSTIGLRHQKENGGIIVRVCITPFFNPGTGNILISGGVSLGFAF